MAFVRLHGLLRPFVEQRWAQDVAKLNQLEESRLRTFLFGAIRTQLTPVKRPMLQLQNGRCFYCVEEVGRRPAEVDHFIPWSRHSDDSLHNLVVAHAKCNNDKSDFLAGVRHLRSWYERNERQQDALAKLSQSLSWELGEERTLGAARALYLRLPPTARLWVGQGRFEVADPGQIQHALA